jgi:hypothetical protein
MRARYSEIVAPSIRTVEIRTHIAVVNVRLLLALARRVEMLLLLVMIEQSKW